MPLCLFTHLSRDLTYLYKSSFRPDVTLVVIKGDVRTNFQAHSFLLWARAPYFRDAMAKNDNEDYDEEGNNRVGAGSRKFTFRNISVEVFRHVLEYIYTGVLPLETFQPIECVELLQLLLLLKIPDMIEEVQDRLLSTQNRLWISENLTVIGAVLNAYEGFRNRLERLYTFYTRTIFSQEQVHLLNIDAIENVLRNGAVELSASEIWKTLLRWRARRLKRGDSSDEVRAKLARCVPFVKFLEMPADEIVTYVLPNEDLLPRAVVRDLLEHHLKNTPRSTSENVSPQPFATLALEPPSFAPKPTLANTEVKENEGEGYRNNEEYVWYEYKNEDEDEDEDEDQDEDEDEDEDEGEDVDEDEDVESPSGASLLPQPTYLYQDRSSVGTADYTQVNDGYSNGESITVPRERLSPPQSVAFIDSLLISMEHVALIATYIDKCDNRLRARPAMPFYKPHDVPHRFRLLQRASRDGYTASVFHRLCDARGPTVCVARLRDSSVLVGGFNPLSWSSTPGFRSTPDSFIFYMDDCAPEDVEFLRVRKQGKAIRCGRQYGPNFGAYNLRFMPAYDARRQSQPLVGGMYDVDVYGKFSRLAYNKPFAIDDYEVFLVER